MAQVNGTENQTASKASASSLFASLRTSFNLDGVKGGLFSSLLAQSKNAAPLPVVAPEQPAVSVDSRTSGATTNAKRDNSVMSDPNEDAARVRAALRQVREDIDEVRASRKRDEAMQAKAEGADKKSGIIDNVKTEVAATVATPTAKPEEQAVAEKDAVAEPVLAEAKIEAPLVEVAAEAVTAAVVEAPVETQEQAENPVSDKAGEDVLAELLQTEQALALMLQKMLQDKAVNAPAATDGASQNAKATSGMVEAIKNDSAKVAANGRNDAVLAAAFGGAASSVDAASPVGDDALAVEGGALQNPLTSLTPRAGQDNALADKQEKRNVAADLAALFHPVTQDEAPPVIVPNGAALAAALSNAKATEAESGTAARPLVATAANANAAPSPLHAEGARPVGSYDFASQLSAHRATRGGATGLPAAVEQVTLQLHKMAKAGADQMTLQLRPAELGRIDIKLEFAKDGSNTVKGIVIADTQAALDMLQKDSGGLQRALQDAGLRADSGSLQFNLRGDGQQNASAQNGNGQSASGNGAGGFASANDGSEATTANAAEETYYITPGRVNLRV